MHLWIGGHSEPWNLMTFSAASCGISQTDLQTGSIFGGKLGLHYTAYWVKLSGEDLSHYSNKIESLGWRKCLYYAVAHLRPWQILAIQVTLLLLLLLLLRKWCYNNEHFLKLAPHRGGKTAGIDMVWRNYIVTLCIHNILLHLLLLTKRQ